MVNNNLNQTSCPDFLFNKYSITPEGDTYVVHRYDTFGRKHEITETNTRDDIFGDSAVTRDDILSGRAVRGAIGYTKDKKHTGWLHIVLYVAQTVHEYVTGRWRKLNPDGIWKKSYANSCHGVILTGEAKDNQGRALAVPAALRGKTYHPMMSVDPLFPGIIRHAHDHAKDVDITKFYIYVPKDPALADLICQNAVRSSFPKKSSADSEQPIDKWKFYHPECISDVSKKLDFNMKGLVKCLAYNSSKKLVEKNPSARVRSTTALMLADLILAGPAQLKDTQGQKRSFFCCSYVTTLLQGALFMRNLNGLQPGALESFSNEANGTKLGRQALQAKITQALAGDMPEDAVAKRLHETFLKYRFARADGEYLSSGRFVELADKNSFKKLKA